MHACGHDTHMASLLGAAQILAEFRDELNGSVKFLFQPAEEINLGAKKMMELNCLENPKGGCNLWYAQFTGDPGRNCGSQKWTTDGGRGSYYFHH